MKYLSVCSGIEAATVAWHPLGWKAAAYSEIEKFPSAVLEHHYPTVPNLGDMTKFKEWDLDSIDLLVGGTPCQSFSVAGLRKGLEDPRGNLALVYCGILDRFRPQWFVWENVPGVLSSNSGRDFGSFLGALAELGYGFAYRVLDAQYFGVAQRRRRVFVVGYFGDWRPAAEVLFEPESVRGDPAPSREKGEKIANCFTSSPSQHRSPNEDATLITTNRMVAFGEYVDDGTASTMKMRDYKDATDLVVQPIAYNITFCDANGTRSDRPDGGLYVNEVSVTNTLTKAGIGTNIVQPITQYGDIAGSLTARHDSSACADRGQNVLVQPMAYNIAPGKGVLKDDIHVTYADATKTLDASGSNPAMHQGGAAIVQPISFSGQMSVPSTGVDMTPTLQAKNPMAVAQPIDPIRYGKHQQDTLHHESGIMSSLPAGSRDNGGHYTNTVTGMAVRRLSPKECERLQGFPDGYTDIRLKDKDTPDGPRYKALGNSMAVPVMAWIGKRINDYMEKQ
jgi:DNA (cytosine-5)-methyltransferase 1